MFKFWSHNEQRDAPICISEPHLLHNVSGIGLRTSRQWLKRVVPWSSMRCSMIPGLQSCMGDWSAYARFHGFPRDSGKSRWWRISSQTTNSRDPLQSQLFLQSLFTLILHLALLWRQLPFMKYSRCEAPSRSVTVLSCSFFGAPEPVRGCTAFLKLKAMQNSYCCCNNAARTAHTGRNISLWARYRSLLQIARLWWQGLCSFCTLLDLSIDSRSFWLTKKTCSSLYSWLRPIRM